MRVAPVHDHVDAIETAFEETLVGVELERVRHDARGVSQHPVRGDDRIAFDATRADHGAQSFFPAQASWPGLAAPAQVRSSAERGLRRYARRRQPDVPVPLRIPGHAAPAHYLF